MSSAVTPLREDDRPAWDRLWAGYLDFYRVDLADDVTETTWRRLLDPDVDLHGLGARDGGALVGIAHYSFQTVTWSVAGRCYLEDLYVDPAARGAGIGRRLIEAVYAAADSRGADQVYWLTQESNVAARRLYDRVGRRTDFIKYRR